MKRLLREPLLHFLLLGAGLFLLYGWLQGGFLNSPDEIVVSRTQIQGLQLQFERAWRRPPTDQEFQGLIDSWVREEILYREGLAMGLDRDDPIVRRRVGQKVEFIVDGMTPAPPTIKELQAWLDTHADRYALPALHSLRQVYFDPSRHVERLQADVAAALERLREGEPVAGDATLLPQALEAAHRLEVERNFGGDFATAIESLPVGGWQGPLRSEFGLHLVEVTVRVPGRNATLEEARSAVERDLLHARAEQASDAYYQRLRANYRVRIERAGEGTAVPAG
jgi:PPIC-type PPIASE domain